MAIRKRKSSTRKRRVTSAHKKPTKRRVRKAAAKRTVHVKGHVRKTRHGSVRVKGHSRKAKARRR